jgi:predicted nucleic acid-binding protein
MPGSSLLPSLRTTYVEADAPPIHLDSSVVVRYLTDDPPEMAARAALLIDSQTSLAITDLVIAESGCVLTTVYGIDRSDVAEALAALMLRSNIECPQLSIPLVVRALQLAGRSGRVSFADALIWARARQAEAPVATFDRRFPTEGLALLEPT